MFWRLHQFRTYDFGSPNPIMPNVAREWCDLIGMRLSAEEFEVLFEVDAAYRAAVRREQAASKDQGGASE